MLLQLLTILAHVLPLCVSSIMTPNLFIVMHFKTHLYNNLVCPCSWYTVSVMMHLRLLHLLAFKRMKVHSWFAFIYLVFLLPPNTFLFGTSSTVNFTVELSEVLSVVIVFLFLIINILIYTSVVYLPLLLLAGNLIIFFLSLLSVWKIFYILYMNTVILFTIWKRHIFIGVNVFVFSRLKKRNKIRKYL